MQAHITLSFIGAQLNETNFSSPFQNAKITAVRGRIPLSKCGGGTFPWSAGTQAFALLALQTKLMSSSASQIGDSELMRLVGEDKSPVASLDYAISKDTQWLSDIFGSREDGRSQATRIFQRWNSNRKRPGPVLVAFNPAILQADAITVRIDGRLANRAELEQLEKSILKLWANKATPVAECLDWRKSAA